MPTVGVYLLLATLVIPSMVEAGITPFAAHMFSFYFGILSMITPPVAAAAFAAATVAKSDFLKTGITSVFFGWPAYIVPFIFVYSPAIVWQGTHTEIFRIFILSIIGVWAISAGWVGFVCGKLTLKWRILFIVAGALCLLPASFTKWGDLLDIVGICAVVFAVAICFTFSKRAIRKQT